MPCRLEFTDHRFVFAGKDFSGVPLLVSEQHHFVDEVCDYLRILVTHDHLKTTSVKTYAEYLLHFWRFLEVRHRSLTSVVDKDLLEWLNEQEASGVSSLTRAARCDAVFDLFVWLEINGHVQYMVRLPWRDSQERFTPRLTCIPSKGTAYRRPSRYGIASAVRPRTTKMHSQPTPNSEDITSIYMAADNINNNHLTDRNHLLIDWYTQVGLRRHEWVGLTTSQIPAWELIDEIQNAGHVHELRLTVTKGDKPRHVGVLPELLEKTREYMEGPRAALVARFKNARSGCYREPAQIFLSSKTGLAMNLRSVTNLLTAWFKSSQVKGHGHRLRATYLTNLFEAEIEAEESRIYLHPGTKSSIDYELILRKVAERAGHSSIESLRSYLSLARKRRSRSAGADEMVTLQQRIEARRQELAILERRIDARREELGATPH